METYIKLIDRRDLLVNNLILLGINIIELEKTQKISITKTMFSGYVKRM